MIKEIDERISRKLAGIRQAFRGVLTLVRAAGAVQLLQGDGLAGEKLRDNELFQHYGYTSNPPAGTMCVVLPVGGKTQHGIIIATEHGNYRLKGLQSGESALYDDLGQVVHLTRDGIVIKGAGLPITITDTPKVRMECDLDVTGEIKDRCDSGGLTMAEMRDVFNDHNHHENDTGGNTNAPNQTMGGA